jgi:hypothetical protein
MPMLLLVWSHRWTALRVTEIGWRFAAVFPLSGESKPRAPFLLIKVTPRLPRGDRVLENPPRAIEGHRSAASIEGHRR